MLDTFTGQQTRIMTKTPHKYIGVTYEYIRVTHEYIRVNVQVKHEYI